jgi:hypothetical protein
MSFTYITVDNITYKGYPLYYKSPIDITIHKASIFNDKYIYYYKLPNSQDMKLIGRFKSIERRSCPLLYYDCDYTVHIFEEEIIDSSKIESIYCRGIAETSENMILLDDTFYQNFPLYYKATQ